MTVNHSESLYNINCSVIVVYTLCIVVLSVYLCQIQPQPTAPAVTDPKHIVTDYRTFAVVTTVVFAILGPLSLVTGIPAVLTASMVREYVCCEKKKLHEQKFTDITYTHETKSRV